MLKRYLAKGGKVLFMLDPPDKAESGELADIIGAAQGLGHRGRQQRRRRRQRHGPAARHRARSRRSPPSTSRTRSRSASTCSRRTGWRDRSRRSTGGTSGKFAQTLVETSPQQLGRDRHQDAEHDRRGRARDLDKGDKAGPVSLAAAVSSPATDVPRRRPAGAKPEDTAKPETRIVVFGDSDFASNGWLGIPGQPRPVPEHGQLAGAAGEPDLDPAARSARTARITLTADQQDLDLLADGRSSIPGLILLAGVQTWWRRR